MQPTLLIAAPQLQDPFFERTVVLVWYHDEDGAMGVVVNRLMQPTLPEVLQFDGVELDANADNHSAWGGPVDVASGTVITPEALPRTQAWVLDGVSVSHDKLVLQQLIERAAPLRLCLGHAGWGPGQLDGEIRAGGWLLADVDPELVFGTPPEEVYERALARFGMTPRDVWMSPIEE